MNDAVTQMLLRTRGAWASPLLEGIEGLNARREEAAANTAETFVGGLKGSIGELLEAAHRARPFEQDEFLVSGLDKCFLLTSKCLYLVRKGKPVSAEAIPLDRVVDYQMSGWWAMKLRLGLRSGETLNRSVDAGPDKAVVDQLIARRPSWSSTVEPALPTRAITAGGGGPADTFASATGGEDRVEIPNTWAAKYDTVKDHLIYPVVGLMITAVMLIPDWKPLIRYIILGAGAVDLLWLVLGVFHIRAIFAYRMVLSSEGFGDGEISHQWADIERAEVLGKVSADGAGVILHPRGGGQPVRLVIPSRRGLANAVMAMLRRHVDKVEFLPEERAGGKSH